MRLRLMSDVPLGAMLSGGLDSSLIVALMAAQHDRARQDLLVGFREDTSNELDDARRIAHHYGTDHHELELSFLDDTIDLPELVWHLDEPLADLSALGFLALSHSPPTRHRRPLRPRRRRTLRRVRKHTAERGVVAAWNRLPRPAQGVLRASGRHTPRGRRRAFEVVTARARWNGSSSSTGSSTGDANSLLRGPLEGADGARHACVLTLASTASPMGPSSSPCIWTRSSALVDDMLHYFDRMSMAHSLEVRVPFLDHHFVEFAATVPPNLKVNRFRTKLVLKHAARGILPDQIIDKPKIGFFPTRHS